MNLATCPLDAPISIDAVRTDPTTALRWRELGIARGARVRVTQGGGAGGRVLAVAHRRIALDSAACRSIEVAPIS